MMQSAASSDGDVQCRRQALETRGNTVGFVTTDSQAVCETVRPGDVMLELGVYGSRKSMLVRCYSRLHDMSGSTTEVEKAGHQVIA